jgi:hypothetical protein
MNDSHDRDLRDAFEALNREVRATAGSFADLTSPQALSVARGRRRSRRSALLVAAILISVSLALRARSAPSFDFERFSALTGIDPGQVTWRAPSDFLLDTPGRDLLRRVPLIEVRAPSLVPDTTRPPDSNDTKRRSHS